MDEKRSLHGDSAEGPSAEANIRIATERDIPDMHRVRRSVCENRLTNPAHVQPADYVSRLGEEGRGWVAEADGRIVAFAVADLSRSNVWALFVAPEFEGGGIGRRLHEAMMHWLFTAGAVHVWLTTDPGTRAERFYAVAGWRRAGTHPDGETRFEMSREDWLALPAGSFANP
jgi:GNAT superfamily N-acetyltransferase